MSNRLSYSQLRLYSECSQKFKYYYKDKLRERTKSGALFFGTAFDKAIEAVLKDNSINEKEIFDKVFTEQEINSKKIYLPESLLVVYSASDFDADLLEKDDLKFLGAKVLELLPNESTEPLEAYKKVVSYKKQRAYRNLRDNELRYFNLCNWLSLRRKGHLFLEANRQKVISTIAKIVGTQVKVELQNDSGDSLIGYADLVCRLKDHGDEDIVIDYKTSGIEYDTDAVITGQQLTIYAHALGLKKAGYFVFRKNIIKNRVKICPVCSFDGSSTRHQTCFNVINKVRCNQKWIETIKPEVEIQIIIDQIPERTTDIVLENIQVVNKAINNEIYVRNLNACKSPFLCPYIGVCYKNNKDNLEQV